MQTVTEHPSPPRPAAVLRSATDRDALRSTFACMKAAQRSSPAPDYEQRIARLDKLLAMAREYRVQIAEAISDDFGNRSLHETQLAEIYTLISSIGHIKKNLKRWMRPEARRVPLVMQPGSAQVLAQPLGVVGVIAPWNYPFQLALAPVAAALAAGNRVMLKPSEYTPRTALLLRRLIRDAFEPEVLSVVLGGADVAGDFARLPFDHLLFTGSARAGRAVMRAAAENLTRVTLELGGKSPAIVHESFSLGRAAARIAAGKWFNAGQTCIAPDYALVPRAQVEAFAAQVAKHVRKAYWTLKHNPDYTSIINDEHYARVVRLIEDAVARGARRIEVNPSGELLDPADRKVPPTVLLDVGDDMQVMQEEIFGPVLPIVGYDSLDQALAYVNDRPRPLALYYFDRDRARVQHVLAHTVTGGACINDTLVQFAVDDLPFGGVGPSGLGAYHGREGFETFSHRKGVFYQARWNAAAVLGPPYGERTARVIDLLASGGSRSRRERFA